MAPVTIIESFRKNLPVYPEKEVDNNYRQIGPSSMSTARTRATPAFIVEVPQVLTARANAYLSAIRNLPFSPLNSMMPSKDDTIYMHTEADVLRASCLDLIYPVNKALCQILNEREKIYCRGETTIGRSRTDLMWSYQLDGQPQPINFAVLEFKNTKVIHANDFLPGITLPEGAMKVVDTARSQIYRTHLRNNAVPISQQLNKYAKDAAVTDLAVFDWSAMFIFDLTDANYDSQTPALAKGTFFQENATNVGLGETFRVLLLGFLLRALERKWVVRRG
ncbi:hypothetical protein McanMca71_004591 [Microsporum canis]|uniref:Fungal-type protein kinase domain-containing protein n=1 Tax=Arthroderma otae (strain ATCC MYA-4605 / CBS 113480) TaxID=554155 RepID=C5FUQ7_ARTOC|nr:conserved hypothetical protein [Microsporum canis CBS 113480]EEQ33641.1 conserved hypothetical protein [Microsporum canis CBS 113480]